MFLLLAASIASAEEFFVSGNRYEGQPVVCSAYDDAAELAEIYVNKSIEEFSGALSIKTREALCFSEMTISFTPTKETSAHKGKGTVYVVEVFSGEIFYIVTLKKVFKFTKKSILV
jgi:hypothetical protein